MKVTLETKCWEGDWERVLKTNWLDLLWQNNCYDFSERVLIINNVQDYKLVTKAATEAIERGRIHRFVIAQDFAQEALDFFNLSEAELGKGYNYSIAELVSIYTCQTEFLLHYASDSIVPIPCHWIEKALTIMNQEHRIKVAHLLWNGRFQEAESESFLQTEDFFFGYGFSDQSYLVRTTDFRNTIYNETHPDSQRYPEYGGELFEKRVDSWMRKNEFLRAIFKHGTYLHNPILIQE